MTLPELVRRRAEKELKAFCKKRVPGLARNQVRSSMSFADNPSLWSSGGCLGMPLSRDSLGLECRSRSSGMTADVVGGACTGQTEIRGGMLTTTSIRRQNWHTCWLRSTGIRPASIGADR